jgi:hypothetical protein
MNKKIILAATAMITIALLLIIFSPTGAIQRNSELTGKPDNSGIQILQGKITPNGDLFIILEKVPLQDTYNCIQPTANDPHFELVVFSPQGGTATLSEQINNGKYQNSSIHLTSNEITTYDFTVPLTEKKGDLNLTLDGVGYFNIPEQLITPSPIPFYNLGQLSVFTFVTIVTTIIILFSFMISVAATKRAKYFPPLPASKMSLLIFTITIIIIYEYTQNYYSFIQESWLYLEIPLIFTTTLIFMSYIPQHTKKGILIRFLDERTNGEAYTDIMPILTAETPPNSAPTGWRDAGMEYIDKKSYIQFLKRLIGIHTQIIFQEGKLPDEITKPRTIKQEQRRMKLLKRFTNKKRETSSYDFGYLIAPKFGDSEEIIEENIEMFPTKKILKNRRFLKIPLSGHHSTYIEQFLAGLADAREEGDRIESMKEQLATKEAEILSGTYLNDTMIINKLGELLHIDRKKETKNTAIEKKEEETHE